MNNIDKMYNQLRKELIGATGESIFTLNQIAVKMKSRDSIGNLLQDWLEEWFKINSIKYSVLENTQEFPDYKLYFKNQEELSLEVKSWNFSASPAFDLANFESYIKRIEENPKILFAKYLIFGYSISAEGEIKINELYLKNIWELTGPATKRPLTIQMKEKVIYNIRPKNFTNPKITVFENPKSFLEAIRDQMNEYDKNKKDMDKWFTHITNTLSL